MLKNQLALGLLFHFYLNKKQMALLRHCHIVFSKKNIAKQQ